MIENWIDTINFEIVIRVLLILVIGYPFLLLMRKWVRVFITKHYSDHNGMLVSKIVFYIGFGILFVSLLHEMGFKLGPILGAAGIISVAIAFASQTSISNIISGFFLLAEKPFKVGDVISVDGNIGAVLSIDTLSIKIRMFDNRFLRIPNETMIKSQVFNFTRFPIRRTEFIVSVAYKEDMDKVRTILLDLADKNAFALQEPSPVLIFDGFKDSSCDFRFNVWSSRDEFLNLRNSLYPEIHKRFREEDIEIPFPHVSLYTGDVTKAFPIKITGEIPGDVPKELD